VLLGFDRAGVLDRIGGGMTIPSAEGFLQASSCLPCTVTEEREVVDALTREAEKNVKHGDLRYLVSQRWCLPISPLLFP